MPDRDLDITKFSYPAYRKLKKTLGEFDAVVECNEIAIKEFIEQAKGKDVRDYVSQLSSKHKVKVNEVDFFKFNSRIRQYYVTSVFQQSEQFLIDFKTEFKQYNTNYTWKPKQDGETVLVNVLGNTSVSFSSDLIEVYDYYRIVRNYMAHTDRDLSDLRKRYKRILSNENEFLSDLNIQFHPNGIEDINFSDFLILTNIVKHIAYIISTSSKPTNDRIAEILFDNLKSDGRAYKGIKKLKNNPERYEKALNRYIRVSFGRFSNNDLNLVSKKLISLLA